ncbi:MAG: methyltransferase domain-containing protein [Desulfobacterium sp.]|nr:methyltransferase domain-containing protein [Desulfobacterium sp.]
MKRPEKKKEQSKINRYIRFEVENTAIYVDPYHPNWIAVNRAGDTLLKNIGDQGPGRLPSFDPQAGAGDILWEISKQKFLNHLPDTLDEPYRGRGEYIPLSHLDECWLHVTDNCNLKCTHCLFSCSPEEKTALSIEDIKKSVDETYALGARIFYLTGGEPFVHKSIGEILNHILNHYTDTSLVVMTNGILLPQFRDLLKTLPKGRLCFQVSADGVGEIHDKTRGRGGFAKLAKGLESLGELGTRNTLAMVVHHGNISQMTEVIDLAKEYDMDAVHFIWLMVTGSATPGLFVAPETLFLNLVKAYHYAEKKGIEIDNIRNMESQVFSPAGTKYDLGNAGWRSLAIGPDKNIYPTAAMVGRQALNCGNLDSGIEHIWQHSEILKKIRKTSVRDSTAYGNSPFKFITGGGDMDHSYFHGGTFEGCDPYLPLYEKMIPWIIAENAKKTHPSPYPRILLKMGDRLLQCHSEGEGVSLTHSNCVLTFSNTRKVVGDFYARADGSGNQDIVNPVSYPETEISHIPDHSRIKSYGCGSPVLDADIKAGEVIADLGSGAGVECFIASKRTGKNGKVYGIDMLDHMLDKANTALPHVAENLGYTNIEFKKGFLEAIPLKDDEADLIISNCVINLSEDKRETLKEIFRVLKPGGRIVISDVVTDTMAPPAIQNDEQLRGECIAGAMVQPYLISMLEILGFTSISIMKRFFYRKVRNHAFFSITYTAYKPRARETVAVVYPGPYAAVVTDHGEILVRGEKCRIEKPFHPESLSPDILVLDAMGSAANIDAENSCNCSFDSGSQGDCCSLSLEEIQSNPGLTALSPGKNRDGCMICGNALEYLKTNEVKSCFYCSKKFSANAVCKKDHFVCDSCHGMDALAFVTELLIRTKETDLIDLLNKIRSHPSFNLHGPEHHYAVPGIIAAVYRNLGGGITDQAILTAIERGSAIPGGSCAFWGGCGAPLGAGIGFGVILDANPLKPGPRQMVQKTVSEITGETGKIKAARCCQRESWVTLLKVSEISERALDIKLPANGHLVCTQMDQNKECIKAGCPFYPNLDKPEPNHSFDSLAKITRNSKRKT